MEKHGKLKPAKIKIQRTVNVGIVFKFIQQYVKLVGVGPQDIVEGNPKVVLGLIWTIFSTFALRKLAVAVRRWPSPAVAGRRWPSRGCGSGCGSGALRSRG